MMDMISYLFVFDRRHIRADLSSQALIAHRKRKKEPKPMHDNTTQHLENKSSPLGLLVTTVTIVR